MKITMAHCLKWAKEQGITKKEAVAVFDKNYRKYLNYWTKE